jgi:hypothetical protein
MAMAQAGPKIDWSTRSVGDSMLTGSQRVESFLVNNFASQGAFYRSVGPAIGQEMSNTPREWGRTTGGFGRRVGVNFVMFTSQDLIQSSSAAMLGRDPRYQRCECKGIMGRTGHAIAGVFVSANANGKLQFDPSNLIGSYGAGYLGSTLYPDRYSRAVKGGQLGHQLVGSAAIQNILLEFRPEIKKLFREKILRKK